LSRENEDYIRRQLQVTENQIADEINAFEERRYKALGEDRSRRKTLDPVPHGDEPERTNQDVSDIEPISVEPQDADVPATDIQTQNDPAAAVPENTVIVSSPDQSRDYLLKGEEYVQGEEDSVIY
jgi:hypothetical protein